MQQFENRVDARNVELVRDLMATIDKTASASQRTLDTSIDRVLNLIKQLGDQLGNKTNELTEAFGNL